MKKIKIIFISVFFVLAIPFFITAAALWSGYEVYYPEKNGDLWGIKESEIVKITNPGAVYGINDLPSYSAYISNRTELIGNTIDKGFYWYNKSRLGYVKLIKVTPGQEVSFLFSAEKYVYCAEYSADYKLLADGVWLTTGDAHKLNTKTEWIMLVFRNATGDLSAGGGLADEIRVSDISNLTHKYLILQPFTYTFKLNGGSYNGNTNTFTLERLGVTKMTLPTPKKEGYIFTGWKATDGRVYETTIPVEYNQALFGHSTLEATWSPIRPSQISLNKTDFVLEENSEEKVQLVATVKPDNALNKSVTWSSSDPSVASVSNNGVVVPHKSGRAVITAKTENGYTASCVVYVMGFKISLPEYCMLNECYEIKIDVYNNGSSSSSGRKHILLYSDDSVEIARVGDLSTSCMVLAETSSVYEGNYRRPQTTCIVDTMVSTSVFYRLKSTEEITKNGDYEGLVTFNVSVQ